MIVITFIFSCIIFLKIEKLLSKIPLMNQLNIIIPDRLIGQRIDAAIAQLLPDYSRSKITNWVRSGGALINCKSFKHKEKVLGGEIIALSIKAEKTNEWKAEDIPLDVVYEDDDIIVINKPVGLVTHPGAGNWTGTLANGLLHYDPSLATLDRAGIVHRLEKIPLD
jgi:23S rRNA pseudouridine1911/1915/1917 synthase